MTEGGDDVVGGADVEKLEGVGGLRGEGDLPDVTPTGAVDTGRLDDIRAIVDKLGDAAPVFGLTKEGTEGVYITPSVASGEAVAAAHAEGVLFMADCATPDEARAALEAGCDLMSTILAGYTPDRAKIDGPDLDCVRDSRNLLGPDALFIGEGRYRTPAEAAHGLLAGADAVIVGTAITEPGWITAQFAAHLH